MIPKSIASLCVALTFLFFLPTSSLLAQKCEVKSDPVTGDRVVQFMNKQQTLRYKYEGGETIDFFTTFIYSGEHNIAFPAGTEVIMKLEDGLIITLKSALEATPRTEVTASQYGASIRTFYTFNFLLSKEQVNQIASAKLVFLRYPNTDGGTIDLDIKGFGKIYAKKINSGAECMSENL